MIVRELISRFGFKVDKGQFQKAESGFNKLKFAAVALVGSLVAGKLGSIISNITTEAAALADQIDKTSLRLGVNAQALQELQFAANLAGASNQDLSSSLRILSRNADEAATGSAEYGDEFKRLGVNVKDSSGNLKSAETLLEEMGDGLNKLKGDTERVAIAQKLLGRGGAALIPLLTQGTEAIKAQREEARELGLFDEELIGLGVELTDTNRRLEQVTQSFSNVIAKELLPGLIGAKTAIVEWWKANRKAISQKMEIVIEKIVEVVSALASAYASMFKFQAKILAPPVMVALRLMGRLFQVIAGALRLTRDLAVDVWAKLDPIKGVLMTIGKIALGIAAFITLPLWLLGLIPAAIMLIVDDFLTWREGGDSLFGMLDEKMGGVLSSFFDLIDEVREADGALAAMGVVAGKVFDGIASAASSVGGAIGDTFTNLWDLIKSGADMVVEYLKTIFGPVMPILEKVGGFVGGQLAAPIKGVMAAGSAVGGALAGSSQVATVPDRSGGSFAPSTEIKVEVQPPPGGSPEEYGNVISKMIGEALSDTLRQTGRTYSTAEP